MVVEEKIYDDFVANSRARANRRMVGDFFDPGTEQGLQVDSSQFGRTEGAKLVCGGDRVGDRGYFIQPTGLCGWAGRQKNDPGATAALPNRDRAGAA